MSPWVSVQVPVVGEQHVVRLVMVACGMSEGVLDAIHEGKGKVHFCPGKASTRGYVI